MVDRSATSPGRSTWSPSGAIIDEKKPAQGCRWIGTLVPPVTTPLTSTGSSSMHGSVPVLVTRVACFGFVEDGSCLIVAFDRGIAL